MKYLRELLAQIRESQEKEFDRFFFFLTRESDL